MSKKPLIIALMILIGSTVVMAQTQTAKSVNPPIISGVAPSQPDSIKSKTNLHENTSTLLKQEQQAKLALKVKQAILEAQINAQQQQIIKNQELLMQQQQMVNKQNSFPTKVQYQWIKGAKPETGLISEAKGWANQKLGRLPKTNRVIAWVNNGVPAYICQSDYFGGVHPGQLTKEGCKISYRGQAFIQPNYQILVSDYPVQWEEPAQLNRYRYEFQPLPKYQGNWPDYGGVGPVIPQQVQSLDISRPIVGGNEKGYNLYICRGMYENEVHVGKVVANYCNIGWQGQEKKLPMYEVLFQNVAQVNHE